MKSYIKIHGPPVLKAIQELEKIAVDVPEVCIMDNLIEVDHIAFSDPEYVKGYWNETLNAVIDVKRCGSIISKSGESVGEYDFYFEWFTKPDTEQLRTLIKKIDDALAPTGAGYTITSK